MAFLDKVGLQRFWEIILSKFATKEEINGCVAKEELNGYVAKEEGKGLSSNDYTTAEKQKLESLAVMNEITNAQIDEICGATIVSGSEVSL